MAAQLQPYARNTLIRSQVFALASRLSRCAIGSLADCIAVRALVVAVVVVVAVVAV